MRTIDRTKQLGNSKRLSLVNLCYYKVMDFEIRKMQLEDKKEILTMMKEFYSTDAVATN